MKGQVKALVVAMALAAGSANAAIDTAGSGNGELYFTMWDTVTQVAFTKDLGIKMDNFLVGSANATSNIAINLAADTNWSSFLTSSTAGNSVWMIGANDNTTKASAGGSRYLSTSGNGLSNVTKTTNSAVNAFDLSDSWLGAVNARGTNVSQADGSAITIGSDTDYSFPQSTLFDMSNWSGKAVNFTTTGGANDSLGFYFLTTNGVTGAAGGKVATIKQYSIDASTDATWSVNLATNTLNYNGANEVVATPIPAAAWLLGSALLGLVGVGRRQSKTNVIAA